MKSFHTLLWPFYEFMKRRFQWKWKMNGTEIKDSSVSHVKIYVDITQLDFTSDKYISIVKIKCSQALKSSSSVPSDSEECLLISAKFEIFENFCWNLEHLFGEIQWNKFVCDVVHGTKNESGNDMLLHCITIYKLLITASLVWRNSPLRMHTDNVAAEQSEFERIHWNARSLSRSQITQWNVDNNNSNGKLARSVFHLPLICKVRSVKK